MSRAKSQRGQAMVLTLVFLTVLLGMAAAVIDVGSWYRAHRQTQSTADATALAGAQDLPNTGPAQSLALDYAGRNGGGVTSADITFSSDLSANDTIHVTARKTVPGLFTKLFGLNSVTARSVAAARIAPMASAKWAAPIGVDYRHDKLHCTPSLVCHPEFGVDTEAPWRMMPAASCSDPGMKPDSANFKHALDTRLGPGHELLLPIYNDTRGDGAGFDYHVVGWAGYQVTGYDINGSKRGHVYGKFVEIIWEGIESTSGGPDFGARAVELTQ